MTKSWNFIGIYQHQLANIVICQMVPIIIVTCLQVSIQPNLISYLNTFVDCTFRGYSTVSANLNLQQKTGQFIKPQIGLKLYRFSS